MNLVTPDSGLLFWMVVIFGLVFFLLWKFGFPVITSMVEKRNATIEKSLKDAHQIEAQMAGMLAEHAQMLEDARKEQAQILREATDTRNKILADARTEIEAEKEAALRDVRREVAVLSVSIAEKILRKELADDRAQRDYIDRMVEEAVRDGDRS